MRKKILLMLSVFCFFGATVFGQAIEGGAGIIHVTGNPNENVLLNTVTENEGNIAYDADNQVAYYYDPAGADAVGPFPGGTAGTHWIAVDISGLVDPITSIVVDAAGSPELTATTVAGVTTLSFESDATLTFNNTTNILTFTDVDGDTYPVDFTTLTDLVDVQAGDPSVTVTGDGSTASPYLISVTGAATPANAGMIPVTDGAGNLSWTDAVTDADVTADGLLQITLTDGSTQNINLDAAPKVANQTELDAAADALGAGESGIAIAADDNTFGMPATSKFGVIFFIKKL